jgi:hypothetical protein
MARREQSHFFSTRRQRACATDASRLPGHTNIAMGVGSFQKRPGDHVSGAGISLRLAAHARMTDGIGGETMYGEFRRREKKKKKKKGATPQETLCRIAHAASENGRLRACGFASHRAAECRLPSTRIRSIGAKLSGPNGWLVESSQAPSSQPAGAGIAGWKQLLRCGCSSDWLAIGICYASGMVI